MSQFLPESGSTGQTSGSTAFTPGTPASSKEDIALMQKVLQAAAQSPNLIPSDFMAYLVDYIQTSRLIIPIGQVFGFSQFAAVYTLTDDADTSASTTYGDLATTTGPTINGLSDGSYVVLFGAYMRNNTAAKASLMSLQVNSTAAVDDDFCGVTSPASVAIDNISVSRAVVKQLSNGGSNILSAKYRVTGGTGTFQHRWMIALKFANH